MTRTIAFTFEVQWNGTNWVDESDYLLQATGNEEIANPEESAFASGGFVSEASFTLFNLGQRFSPTSGGDLDAYLADGAYYQKKVRFTIVLGGTSTVAFRGFIKGITEKARGDKENGSVVLRCTSEDAAIMSKKVTTLNATTYSFYEQNKDEGQLIAQTLSLAGLSDGTDYVSQDLGSGTPTIDRGLFVIPWYWLDNDSALEDCWKVAAACGGRFYFNTNDGKYYYENMQAYAFGASGTSQAEANEDNSSDISPLYNDKELYEKIKVTTKPRRIGESTVIWEPDEILKVYPGETVTLFAKFTSPVYIFTDRIIKATSTAGFDRTTDLEIAQTLNTQGIDFTIHNTGVFLLFLRSFKITGQLIEGGETVVYTADSPNTAFWGARKGKERAISDNPYIQTFAQGKALCDLLAGRQGYATNKYSVKGFKGTAFLRPGYMIDVVNDTIGVDDSGIVLSSSWTLGLGTFDQNLTLFSTSTIYPRPNADYFVIGTHSQNSSKRYFY
jgi:hypothetical protein